MDKFELIHPVKPLWLTQGFGGDKATYGQFGLNGHNGIDVVTAHGQPVYATHDGQAYYEVDSSQGHGVVIRTNKAYEVPGHGKVYMKTIYWHLCDPKKEPKLASPVYLYSQKNKGKGMSVKAGDIIGYADNTGFSTGDHLHFGLKPQAKGEKNSAWVNTAQNNGYLGAIDPMPFFKKMEEPSFDGSIISLQKCLKAEGLFPDGVEFFENYGPITKKGVIAFQKRYGIWPAVGFFGPVTKARLRILYP